MADKFCNRHLNALAAAKTMAGIKGNTIYAVPADRLQAVLRKYSRLADAKK